MRGLMVGVCLLAVLPAFSQTTNKKLPNKVQKARPASAPKSAPAASPAPTKFPLESVKVQGNSKFTSERIVSASGLKMGQAVDKADFDAARERLLSTGGFESVGYTFTPSKAGTGYDAVFEVMETTPFFHYRFEELPASEEVLRAALAKAEPLFGDEIPATRNILERYEKALSDFFQGKTMVEGRLRSDLAGEPTILFRPPGDRPRIAEVRFAGNELIDTAKLANTFSAVAIGAAFTDPNVRLLLDTSVRRLYEAKGRLRVSFPKIEGVPSTRSDVKGINLTVTVDEGPEFKLGTVRFIGVAPNQQKETENLTNFKSGEVADFDAIDSGLTRLIKRYKGNGYLKVATKVDRNVHDGEKTVDIVVTVTPGPQYVYGKLTINGLDILSEPAVRKYWGERAGKPFDPDAPDAFLNNVREERMFDNLGETIATTQINDDTRTADVTLSFKGAPPPDRQRRRRSF